MSEAVRSMFDAISDRYDTLNRVLSAGRDAVWRSKAAKMLNPANHKMRVLDLCGGTGDFSLALSRQGIQAECIVGDFSGAMLKQSRVKGFSELSVLDALNPPFHDSTFDAVLCGFGMRNLDNLEAGIRHVHGLLKPGGKFLTLEFFRPDTAFSRFFYRGLAPVFIPFLGGAMGSRRTAYEYLVNSVQKFRSAGEYVDLCRNTGFEPVSRVVCDFGIAHAVLAVKRNENGK